MKLFTLIKSAKARMIFGSSIRLTKFVMIFLMDFLQIAKFETATYMYVGAVSNFAT